MRPDLESASTAASAASGPIKAALASGGLGGLSAVFSHSVTLGWLSLLMSVLGLLGVWHFNRANHKLAQRKLQLEEDEARMRRLEHQARMAAFAARQVDPSDPTSPAPLQ